MNIKSKIKQLIIQSLSDSNITIDTPVIEISTNNRPDINADFATNICMKYASFANMKPIELAELLKEKLDKSTLFVDVIISNPGFINFKVSNELLIEYAMPFKNSTYKPSFESKILNIHYEYVSANPTGDLHIGHARNAVVGDSAIRSLEYIGHNVTKEY
ncbi:MAG: arginine--tRNA ligase [Tenericutes bacterium]|nr:MAG: arginine--tRNA ligase [Mycoplasmatota bacterium]